MRPIYKTKSIAVGIILTLITAAILVLLVFFTHEFYSRLVLTNIIAFQLSFIWTCAELLDGSGDEEIPDDEPRCGDFSQ
jgi:uncharacterized membrane protein